jgi:hypothetical protein
MLLLESNKGAANAFIPKLFITNEQNAARFGKISSGLQREALYVPNQRWSDVMFFSRVSKTSERVTSVRTRIFATTSMTHIQLGSLETSQFSAVSHGKLKYP